MPSNVTNRRINVMATNTMEKMKSLVRGHDTCVMATVSEGRPHCSLMAYAVDDACGEIYMVTPRTTRKYKNLVNNPHVSLLIDTREEHAGHRRPESKALTVEGEFRPIMNSSEKRLEAEARLTAAHPYLKDFMKNQDAEIISVKAVSFLLLEGLSEAYYEKV
jgi:nitroimidazol reductase NimA-like FMN-containing flavoprotein (pyridoxamine 5'-phosphate oxidase superfamily)